MIVNKLKKKYNNIVQINLFNNEILCGNNLILCNNNINEETNPNYKGYLFPSYEENADKNINNKEIVNLNKNNIYLVLGHYHRNHIHHIFNELVQIVQFYENELKDFNHIKIITNKIQIESLNHILKFSNYLPYFKDFLITNEKKFYKGNFLYFFIEMKHSYPDLYKNNIFKDYFSIFKRIVKAANDKYNRIYHFDNLWISRRDLNIDNYWHKRFNTSIINNQKIVNTLKSHFHEIHFPLKDMYYQIYLMSKAKVVFAEIGSGFNNMYFMNKNTHWFSDTDYVHEYALRNISFINRINLKIFPTIKDTKSKYHDIKNRPNTSFNEPYKFEDDNDFINFINKEMNNIKN